MEIKRYLIHFQPASVAYSPRVQQELSFIDIALSVIRHLGGDWGEVPDDQEHENNINLKLRSGSLLSIFQSHAGNLFWVITEGSWQQTAVLFPEEIEEWECFHRAEGPESTVH